MNRKTKLTVTQPSLDLKCLTTTLTDYGLTFVLVPTSHVELFRSMTPDIEWSVLDYDSNLLRKEV